MLVLPVPVLELPLPLDVLLPLLLPDVLEPLLLPLLLLLPTVVVFNKIDLAEDDTLEELSDIYEKCGCKVIFISTYDNKGIDIVLRHLRKRRQY